MVSTTLVPVQEYLSMADKPACDYLDGVLHQAEARRKHGGRQARLSQLLNEGFPEFEAGSEVTVQIRAGK